MHRPIHAYMHMPIHTCLYAHAHTHMPICTCPYAHAYMHMPRCDHAPAESAVANFGSDPRGFVLRAIRPIRSRQEVAACVHALVHASSSHVFPLTHLLARSRTHSLTHLLTHLLTHSLTHSHPPTPSLPPSLTHSLPHTYLPPRPSLR